MEQFLRLKEFTNCIHNQFTQRITEAFIKSRYGKVVDKTAHSNANGYDIRIINDSSGKKTLAEVKTTIPCTKNNSRFGAAQKNAINKDIASLVWGTSGNRKARRQKVSREEFEQCRKFMIF